MREGPSMFGMCGTKQFEIVEGASEQVFEYDQRTHEENLHATVTIAIDRGEHALVQFEDIVPSL